MLTLPQLRVPQTGKDDPEFVDLVSRVLNGAVRCYEPDDVFIIQIDNWFDHKWKSYSGKVACYSGSWFGPLLRIPPFHPGRVCKQLCLRRVEASSLAYEITESAPLHADFSGTRGAPYRRLNQLTSSGLFLWYSSNMVKVDRASLMMYSIRQQENLGWYASFLKRGEWKIGRAYGISTEEVMQFASAGQP